MTNAQKIQASIDNLISEYYQHTQDRLLGKERTTYSLNGRTFDWLGYQREMRAAIKDMQALLQSLEPAWAETRVS